MHYLAVVLCLNHLSRCMKLLLQLIKYLLVIARYKSFENGAANYLFNEIGVDKLHVNVLKSLKSA